MANIKDKDDDELPMDPYKAISYEAYKELLDHRIILLNGEVKEDIVERVSVPLIIMHEKAPTKPVQIWINSFGGTIEDGQNVVDVIRSMKTPIVTRAFGKAMSAAFDIFLAGDYRIVYPNSILMCHSGSAAMPTTTLPGITIEAKLYEDYMKRWATFYAEKSKISYKEWLALLKSGHNRYFFPEEALELGLAHGVCSYKTKNLKRLKIKTS